jgi:hypothetical protein
MKSFVFKKRILNDKTIMERHSFTRLTPLNEIELRKKYKIVEVNFLNTILVNNKMYNSNLYDTDEIEIVNKMMKAYLINKDAVIFKKTEYLCNKTNKICICNLHADNLRKIYDGRNYEPNVKYVSFVSEKNSN